MPSIQQKDGRIVQMAVPLLVMNGTRAYGEKSYRNMQSGEILNKGYDNVWILTKDEGFMAMIQNMKLYDTIMVKGAVRVSSVKKNTSPTLSLPGLQSVTVTSTPTERSASIISYS